jgi:VanZ family protein
MTTKRNTFLFLAFLYLAFVIYGSLVPLHFQHMPLEDAWKHFVGIQYLELGIGSRADWVANILLFIPLAFLWCGVFLSDRRVVVKWFISTLILAGLIGLSAGIEFTQIFFPPRTVSLNDIIAESIGALIGIFSWWFFGPRVASWLEGWKAIRQRSGRAEKLLWLYLAVLFGYGLLPLDLTISPVEIYHKWRMGQIILVPFVPYISDARGLYELVSDIVIWIPAAFLLVMSGRQTKLRAWFSTVLLSAFLEFLQLFVWTRVTDVNDILTSIVGGGIGVLLGGMVAGRMTITRSQSLPETSRRRLQWGWALCSILWAIILIAVFWYPYNFNLDRSFLVQRVSLLKRVPFYAYYYGTEYRAVTELLHRIFFFAPLGGFIALALGKDKRTFPWRGMVSALMFSGLAFVIEFGRLFISSKSPDSIDLFLEIAGAALGYWGVNFVVTGKTRQSGKTDGRDVRSDDVLQSEGDFASLPAVEGGFSGKRAGMLWLAFGPAALLATGVIVMISPVVPYNLHKLFGGSHPLFTLVMLVAVLYWTFGFPVWMKNWLVRGSFFRVWAFPLLVVAYAAVCYGMLRMAVPFEMIDKIVGSPVLSWPWEWELVGRFIALFAVPAVLLSGGALTVPLRGEEGVTILCAIKRWLIVAVVLLSVAHWVVVIQADTDNLTELMAGGGSWSSSVLLAGWGFVLAQTGTIAAIYLAGYRKRRLMPIMAIMSFSVLIGYCLLWSGTEHEIIKYGQQFSAMQFMLSPDRAHYAAGIGLVLRYVVAHILVVAIIGISQLPFVKLINLFGHSARPHVMTAAAP